MLKTKVFAFVVIISLAFSCQKDSDSYIPLMAETDEALSGGQTTVFDTSPNAFGFFAPNLSNEEQIVFGVGNSLFTQNWVSAPASTTARDGLGPFFNARSCTACHFKDGRGRAPLFDGEQSHGLLIRLSAPGIDANGQQNPDPIYGGQLQDLANLGIDEEGTFTIVYSEETITYGDGSTASLRRPSYSFNNLRYGPMSPATMVSPRVANQMIGLGLLEAIPEVTLLSFEDISDADGDGISGKINHVWDIESHSMKVGRFGWKSNQPTIKQQIAAAFSGDLGITSNLFPDGNCPTGVNCDDYPNGGTPEIDDANLDRVNLYSSTLAVPARRNYDDENILEGKALFNQINCVACHKAKITTGSHPIAALANQTIRPYTDLLLHDMGDGLADNAPEFEASGSEWRTAPLWGIGLIQTVNGHGNLLHDGRARTIEEAILWHGGEALASKNAFMNLSASERQTVLDFVNSL